MGDSISIVTVYPDLLGTYGDGGNAKVLAARLKLRGIAVTSLEVRSSDPLPAGADIYLVGGGEDSPQVEASKILSRTRVLHRAVENGSYVLAVCAGLQIFGEYFVDSEGNDVPGLAILDCRSSKMPGARAVGELLVSTEIDGKEELVVGYENHGSSTQLGPDAKPFSRVVVGVGNSRTAKTDGIRYKNVIATYMHGPVLARNAELADSILRGVFGELPAIADRSLSNLARQLHRERVAAALKSRKAKSVGRATLGLPGRER